MDTPEADIEVDEPLVRRLLREQHPDLADQSLRFVASGWDNAIYRLGDDYAVRLPRRSLAAGLVSKEQEWMPELARLLTVSIPTPIRIGSPSTEFPWRWSVTAWLDGDIPRPGTGEHLVGDLAQFIRELHVEAPVAAPRNPVRGVPLADRDEVITERLRNEPIPRRAEIIELWSICVTAEPWTRPPRWLHGDLHPSNLLTRSGRLTAVIDFGDLTAGDPATDLAVAWLLFDRSGRARFRAELDYDNATWLRARGWAIIFGSLAIGGDATFRAFGEHALREVLVD
jgi:aminoglycoside phosphotransferase (APT) family kinase protein